jgi:hypothetical protein
MTITTRLPAYGHKSGGRVGTIYLLHFTEAFSHARHYLGWTERELPARLDEHADGRGARLLAAVHSAGITWWLARTWPGTRARERQIKRQGGLSRCCPLCGVTPASAADRQAVDQLPARFPQYTGGAE